MEKGQHAQGGSPKPPLWPQPQHWQRWQAVQPLAKQRRLTLQLLLLPGRRAHSKERFRLKAERRDADGEGDPPRRPPLLLGWKGLTETLGPHHGSPTAAPRPEGAAACVVRGGYQVDSPHSVSS